MSSCSNCGAKLSCGCQKRTLANGKQGCTNCANKVVEKAPVQNKPSVQAKSSVPTVNTNTWGAHRYLNLKKFTK